MTVMVFSWLIRAVDRERGKEKKTAVELTGFAALSSCEKALQGCDWL